MLEDKTLKQKQGCDDVKISCISCPMFDGCLAETKKKDNTMTKCTSFCWRCGEELIDYKNEDGELVCKPCCMVIHPREDIVLTETFKGGEVVKRRLSLSGGMRKMTGYGKGGGK